MSKAAFDWSKYEGNAPAFDWSKYEKEGPSRARSIASALPKGLIKGAQALNPFAVPGPVPESLGNKLTEQLLPTQERGLESALETTGKLAPIVATGGETLLAKGLQLAGGVLAKELAKANEIGPNGQAIAEAVGMGVPGLGKGIAKQTSVLSRAPVEKLTSGLTKPAAMGAKWASKAIVSPERQIKAINALNQEASQITKGIVHKRVPVIQKIEEGFNFSGDFEKRFGQLEHAMQKANPQIDITPVSEFLSNSAKKYRGIPSLHQDALKVQKEIRAFMNNPQSSGRNLYKIYRSNSKKIKHIYETSQLTGKQKERVDFLVDMNRNIAKSFENTLPEDSAWIKEFKDLNAEYGSYQRALKTQSILEGALGKDFEPRTLTKIASNPKAQQKLELSLGKKGTDEIVQIGKDLDAATESLKSMSAKELKSWEYLGLFGILMPHTGVAGTAITVKKTLDFLRRGYGWFLSSPARRKQYDNVLKAVIDQNKEAYTKAANNLVTSVSKED